VLFCVFLLLFVCFWIKIVLVGGRYFNFEMESIMRKLNKEINKLNGESNVLISEMAYACYACPKKVACPERHCGHSDCDSLVDKFKQTVQSLELLKNLDDKATA
jgi:hypothetical protein